MEVGCGVGCWLWMDDWMMIMGCGFCGMGLGDGDELGNVWEM